MRKLALLIALLGGCAPYEPDFEEGEIGVWRPGLTVSQAGGCSTAIVAGLSEQLIAEQNCIRPNALVSFAGVSGISVGSAVNPFLEPPAKSALERAVAANGGTLTINSALRTLAQQYLLYKWQGSCGIQIAATPGNSNHETGLAIDVGNYSSYRAALEAEGFAWYGSGDLVHFDYRGAGALDLRSDSVLAFQRLWNANHPGDTILEDGDYGPMTEARLANSPTDGFDVGSTCAPDPDPEPQPEPPPELRAAPLPELAAAPPPMPAFAQARAEGQASGGCTMAPVASNPMGPLVFFGVVALIRRRRWR